MNRSGRLLIQCNRKDGVRGYSSNVSKKRAEMAVIACSALKKRDTQNDARLDTIQSEVGVLANKVAALHGDAILQILKVNNGSTAARVGTPSPEKGSTCYPSGVNGCVP